MKAINLFSKALDCNYDDCYCAHDFILDSSIRSLYDLPPKSAGKEPYHDLPLDIELN